MATFLFRIGRLGPLKRLQLENLGILRTSPAASFCTKTEKPAKPGKKTKSAATEAPDERANLLAYKTAVAFPVRLSGPGCFPAQSVDGTGPAVVSTAESIVAAQAITPVTAASEQVVAEPAADSDSDSTDSDSDSTDSDSDSTDSDSDSTDSESDSDSEDEKKKEIKGFAPEAEPQRITVTGVKAGTIEAQNEYGAPITPGVETPAPLGAAQATVTVPSVGFEKLVKSGPEIITREVTGSDVSAKTAAGVTKDAAFPVDAQIEAPGEPVGEALKDPRSSSAEAAPVAGGEAAEAGAEDARPAEAGAEDARPAEAAAAAEASVCAGSTEEQMDLAPIVTETAGEELQTEATAEHSKEAAAVPSEPEELFDNSTYKNYQHHSYNPYTFADLDMQMAKFRLPQPSSGKPSPRH
ncbi:lisH domain-containing protein C1711.05 isoform X1 [Pundamilia nyererei]|uniref:LisH domain-containing protein C1711.05 isoform X1 n=1 Tax=Pundamilia nyererei TaxID=303518 RepID=A0A9Y3RYY5_9CICH|nr:PREDICTED: NADH dehydrogenase [ubiquinone] flavoprotein 3, mitochondrial isoform X1 [Pundamilia nyererei]